MKIHQHQTDTVNRYFYQNISYSLSGKWVHVRTPRSNWKNTSMKMAWSVISIWSPYKRLTNRPVNVCWDIYSAIRNSSNASKNSTSRGGRSPKNQRPSVEADAHCGHRDIVVLPNNINKLEEHVHRSASLGRVTHHKGCVAFRRVEIGVLGRIMNVWRNKMVYVHKPRIFFQVAF